MANQARVFVRHHRSDGHRYCYWLLFALSLPAFAQHGVTFTWAAGMTPGWTSCTTGSYCLNGFAFYETTSGSPVQLAAVPQTTTSFFLTPLPSKGTHIYTVVQNGLGPSGAPVQSTGNPGIVVNCKKNGSGRRCVPGKSW
jgi:hypothetical protein